MQCTSIQQMCCTPPNKEPSPVFFVLLLVLLWVKKMVFGFVHITAIAGGSIATAYSIAILITLFKPPPSGHPTLATKRGARVSGSNSSKDRPQHQRGAGARLRVSSADTTKKATKNDKEGANECETLTDHMHPQKTRSLSAPDTGAQQMGATETTGDDDNIDMGLVYRGVFEAYYRDSGTDATGPMIADTIVDRDSIHQSRSTREVQERPRQERYKPPACPQERGDSTRECDTPSESTDGGVARAAAAIYSARQAMASSLMGGHTEPPAPHNEPRTSALHPRCNDPRIGPTEARCMGQSRSVTFDLPTNPRMQNGANYLAVPKGPLVGATQHARTENNSRAHNLQQQRCDWVGGEDAAFSTDLPTLKDEASKANHRVAPVPGRTQLWGESVQGHQTRPGALGPSANIHSDHSFRRTPHPSSHVRDDHNLSRRFDASVTCKPDTKRAVIPGHAGLVKSTQAKVGHPLHVAVDASVDRKNEGLLSVGQIGVPSHQARLGAPLHVAVDNNRAETCSGNPLQPENPGVVHLPPRPGHGFSKPLHDPTTDARRQEPSNHVPRPEKRYQDQPASVAPVHAVIAHELRNQSDKLTVPERAVLTIPKNNAGLAGRKQPQCDTDNPRRLASQQTNLRPLASPVTAAMASGWQHHAVVGAPSPASTEQTRGCASSATTVLLTTPAATGPIGAAAEEARQRQNYPHPDAGGEVSRSNTYAKPPPGMAIPTQSSPGQRTVSAPLTAPTLTVRSVCPATNRPPLRTTTGHVDGMGAQCVPALYTPKTLMSDGVSETRDNKAEPPLHQLAAPDAMRVHPHPILNASPDVRTSAAEWDRPLLQVWTNNNVDPDVVGDHQQQKHAHLVAGALGGGQRELQQASCRVTTRNAAVLQRTTPLVAGSSSECSHDTTIQHRGDGAGARSSIFSSEGL